MKTIVLLLTMLTGMFCHAQTYDNPSKTFEFTYHGHSAGAYHGTITNKLPCEEKVLVQYNKGKDTFTIKANSSLNVQVKADYMGGTNVIVWSATGCGTASYESICLTLPYVTTLASTEFTPERRSAGFPDLEFTVEEMYTGRVRKVKAKSFLDACSRMQKPGYYIVKTGESSQIMYRL
jgi:hypothetical protein